MQRRSNPASPPQPLDSCRLRDLALHYVGRYATNQSRLADYLKRKLRERGWAENQPAPNIQEIIEDFARLGYIDDAAYAAGRARSLSQRGYGRRRVAEDLRAKGIKDPDTVDALEASRQAGWQSADRFARRKRIGPYAAEPASTELKQKQMAAFLRAGHDFDVARIFVQAVPGSVIEFEE